MTGGKGRRRAPKETHTGGAEWDRFKEEVESDEYFVGAGSQRLQTMSAAAAAEQTKNLRGIVTGHAYSVLKVYEDGDVCLIELRNPWGRGEWTGDWAPGSRKWNTEEGRRATSAVGPSRKGDGRFWMAWTDFVACFDSIDTVACNFTDEDRARRAALKAEAARIVAKKDRPKATGGAGGGQSGPAHESDESAAAMMELLLAEDAKEKRMKQIGARGNKKGTKKNSGKKKGK